MKIISSMTLTLLLTLSLAAGSAAQGRSETVDCLPMAVATAPLTSGQPLPEPEIVLTSAGGQELARAGFEEPGQVIPSSYPARSIVRSLDGVYSLLAVNDDGIGAIIPLPELMDAGPIQHAIPGFTAPEGSRYTFFSNPAQLSAWIVDLESGKTTSLSGFTDEADVIVSAAVSPGDAWAVVWTGHEIVLLDLSNDYSSMPLAEGDYLGAPWFSDDGGTLFFLRGEAADRTEIIARDLTSGAERILAEEGAWFWFQKFPGDILIVQSPGMLHQIDAAGAGASLLMESTAELRPQLIGASGTTLLVEILDRNGGRWTLVDLAETSTSDLTGVDELYLVPAQPQATWVLLSPNPVPQPMGAGAQLFSLNTETGEITPVFAVPDEGVYIVDERSSSSGRFSVVWMTSTEVGKLWLIDAELGTSELIAESPGGAVGALSPDGCYLAVGIFDTIGEGRQGMVQIVDLETREIVTEIEDSLLLGWSHM